MDGGPVRSVDEGKIGVTGGQTEVVRFMTWQQNQQELVSGDRWGLREMYESRLRHTFPD